MAQLNIVSPTIAAIVGVFMVLSGLYLKYIYGKASRAIREAAVTLGVEKAIEHDLGLYAGGRNLGKMLMWIGYVLSLISVYIYAKPTIQALQISLIALSIPLFCVSTYAIHRANDVRRILGDET